MNTDTDGGFNPQLQRTLLRLIQAAGKIERSALGMKSRVYDQDNWDAALMDLVERGLITESSEIRVSERSKAGQRRAVITYELGKEDVPDYASMRPEEVAEYVQLFPKTVAIAS
jgi:hypothetical protein